MLRLRARAGHGTTLSSAVDTKAKNRLAIVLLVTAKVVGLAGIILGVTRYRVLGGILLGLDAVVILAAIVLAIRNMKRASIVESDDKATLRRMVEEGTLDQYLSDIRAAKKADPDPSAS
ncbi:MAG: hypothetical protein JWP97_698 [Labilithrix sp.]|nr:hypothetical protein [Labilithrix sp.]